MIAGVTGGCALLVIVVLVMLGRVIAKSFTIDPPNED